MLSDEGLSALQPCWGAIMSSQPPHPSASVNMVIWQCYQIESHFQKPALSPHYKSCQAEPAPRANLEDLPFLCAISLVLEHKLHEIYLEISLDFCLEEPKKLYAGNNKLVVVIVTGCPYSVGCTSCVLVYLQKGKCCEQEKWPPK